MTETSATGVSPAASADLPAIVALLGAASLPVADLESTSHPEFLVARRGRRVIGVVGLERFGDVGLLRSLAVSPGDRGRGLGLALTRALEQHAARSGLASLVLLTETARNFFEQQGYQVIARADAPQAVHASSEFRLLCPDSAVCMSKRL
ncbi:MAG TPA: arsenic resistance N-acetyltransferase ArsN2 [Steroidobacteraceae bacterium]|nr:arsenic resistance N-acetyltransferase ArsN2 [Steroidobacteraceae bacterium]